VKHFEDPQYRFEDLDDDGTQYLVKIEIVDLDTVNVGQDGDGAITVTPKQGVETDNGKYRLEPEGDMFRLYATRDIRSGVRKGDKGGLVGDVEVLSPEGACWVFSRSVVTGDSRIRGNAYIAGTSRVDGATVEGDANLIDTSVEAAGCVVIDGSAYISSTRILCGVHGEVRIRGASNMESSVIEVDSEGLAVAGCNIVSAHIRNFHELVSVFHNEWGWLSAYRNDGGGLQFNIGCKVRSTFEEMRYLARHSEVSLLELEMLDHFLAMVAVSQRGWKDYTPPQGDPKSEAAAGSGVESNEVPVMPEPSFGDLAQRAREAVWDMNRPPVVRPAQMDQYGYVHEGQ